MTDTYPSWRYGPKDQSKIFANADDVPAGWKDHPGKVKKVLKAKNPANEPAPKAEGTMTLGEARKAHKAKFGKMPGPRETLESILAKLG